MPIKRQIFYSFHYEKDVFRVQQIRNIGALEDNKPVSANEWEEVKRGGDKAIEAWIEANMKYRSCVVVLVGEETYKRPWVRYEIRKAWSEKKGLVGICIHNLKCAKTIKDSPSSDGKCNRGTNPFDTFTSAGQTISNIVRCYDPDPKDPLNDIKQNLDKWVEEAITVRARYD